MKRSPHVPLRAAETVPSGGIAAAREMISLATVTALLTGVFSITQLGLLFYYDVSLALLALGLSLLVQYHRDLQNS